MEVSIFIGLPLVIIFLDFAWNKPIILGIPHLWKPPYLFVLFPRKRPILFWCWISSLVGHTPMPLHGIFTYIWFIGVFLEAIGWDFFHENYSMENMAATYASSCAVLRRLQRNPLRGASTFWGRTLVSAEMVRWSSWKMGLSENGTKVPWFVHVCTHMDQITYRFQ